jgi:hypothetical protein
MTCKSSVVLLLGALIFAAGGTAVEARRLEAPAGVKTPVTIDELGGEGGRIRIHRGTQKLSLDLARDISGCTGQQYDRSVDEKYGAGASFGLVDAREKAPYVYVVLVAWAPPNCNVQGRCGAGGWDSTLIWLKLTKNLKLAGKQAFAVENCFEDRSAVNLKEDTDEDADYFSYMKLKNLPWEGDVLRIEYREGEGETRWLVFDRQNPEAGLQTTSDGKH